MDKLISGAKTMGMVLSSIQVNQFQVFYEELVRWNQWVNLTTVTNYNEVQVKHFLDSLSILVLEWALSKTAPGPTFPLLSRSRVIDVGTGAGMPGLPLKMLRPTMELTLVESARKKAVFLQHLVALLGLTDVEVVNARAEDLGRNPEYRERFDLALSRAVATLPALVEMALPFCRMGGLFIAQKKMGIDNEIAAAQRAIQILGGRMVESRRVEVPGLAEGRLLVVIEKVSPTPDSYPRRAGIPVKRPL
ncbi:MAG: 16S rRNA (guanine(527)-N(7))-methyltransferase RsmG [Chloroflexi bacterium]|nr:16S rRNA (guanine(527)-N(7))-methyltransferase RsmG [Chloroflexota bacterium]